MTSSWKGSGSRAFGAAGASLFRQFSAISATMSYYPCQLEMHFIHANWLVRNCIQFQPEAHYLDRSYSRPGLWDGYAAKGHWKELQRLRKVEDTAILKRRWLGGNTPRRGPTWHAGRRCISQRRRIKWARNMIPTVNSKCLILWKFPELIDWWCKVETENARTKSSTRVVRHR